MERTEPVPAPEDVSEAFNVGDDDVGVEGDPVSYCWWICASFSIRFSNRLTSKYFFSEFLVLVFTKWDVRFCITPSKNHDQRSSVYQLQWASCPHDVMDGGTLPPACNASSSFLALTKQPSHTLHQSPSASCLACALSLIWNDVCVSQNMLPQLIHKKKKADLNES